MSEFSDGYFLKSDNVREAVSLLERAGIKGYVYPARSGWVAFAADTNPVFKFSEELKEANEGILMQFVNAEDYG